MINVNNGGLLEIGDDNSPTNNKGVLELLDDSKLIIKNGGTLTINENSKIYIRDGATLEIRNGSTINVEDYGEIIVADGGKLLLKGETINLNGDNARIDIQNGGKVQTADGIDFTFTGEGYINYNEGGIFQLGTGSVFRLEGADIDDHILSIRANANLNIDDNDVELTNGHIYYYDDASFTSHHNNVTATQINFEDISGYASYAYKCSGTKEAIFDYCTFSGFDNGLLLENIAVTDITCPAEVSIEHCDFTDQRGTSIDAYSVSRIDGNANDVIAKNASIPYGIFAVDVTDFQWRGSTVEDYTSGTGIYIEDVLKFTMKAGTIDNNETGLESYHSNVFIQNKATIRDNNYGIYMDGANYSETDADELSNLVIGDEGCGWIINNTTAGVKGWDIALDIDAIEHALGDEFPLINRFDGNGIAFDVCVDDNNTAIADDIDLYYGDGLLARGNYWKSSGTPTEGVDFEFNYKGGIGHSCDVAISPVDISDYETTQPSTCSCTLPFLCTVEHDDIEDVLLRLADNSCDETIPEQGN
ncbi:MAG: hypothetical protein R2794_06015 [Chitinophagales bacterium]